MFTVHHPSFGAQVSFSHKWEWTSDLRLILQSALLDVIFGFSIGPLILTSLIPFVYVSEKRYLSSLFCIKIPLISPACYHRIGFGAMRSEAGSSHIKHICFICLWACRPNCVGKRVEILRGKMTFTDNIFRKLSD